MNHLNTSEDIATSKKDIANCLADYFAQKSSTWNYSPKFQKFKQQKEKRKINFKSKNEDAYNKAFTLKE